MAKQVRVRRDRPSGLTLALALAVTMLAVWLVTLSAPKPSEGEDALARRVTRELTFEGVTASFTSLGEYPDAPQARIAAAALAERGAAGYVRASGSRFVVLGACYSSDDDARRVAQRLSADEQLRTDVLTLSAPGATLRVTAAESDCAAIADADTALRAQLDQLSQIALQLDRGEIEPKQARTLAAVARSELTAAREALSDVAGAVDNPVCIGLTDQLDALAATLGEIARGSDAAAALAGRLRCAHVSATLSLIDFLSALA